MERAAALAVVLLLAGCTGPAAPPATAPQPLETPPGPVPVQEAAEASADWNGSVMAVEDVHWVEFLAEAAGTVVAVPWVERSVDDGGDVDLTAAIAVQAGANLTMWAALADNSPSGGFYVGDAVVLTRLHDSPAESVPSGPFPLQTGPTGYLLDREAAEAPQEHRLLLAAAADPPTLVRFWLKPLRERDAALPPSLEEMVERSTRALHLPSAQAQGAWADRLVEASDGTPRWSPGVTFGVEDDGLPGDVSEWTVAAAEHPGGGGWSHVDWTVVPPFQDLQATARFRDQEYDYDALAPSPLPNGTTTLSQPVRGQWSLGGNGPSAFTLRVEQEEDVRPSLVFQLVSLGVDPQDLFDRL